MYLMKDDAVTDFEDLLVFQSHYKEMFRFHSFAS